MLTAIEPEVVAADAAPSIHSRFQTGLAFNLLGAVFNQGSTFVFSVIAANLLGPQTFGKYGIVASTLVTMSQISQLSCGYTATKYVAEFRSLDKDKTGRVIGLLIVVVALAALLAGLILLLGAGWLASSVFKAPELWPEIRIGAAVVVLNVLIGLFMGALAGLEAYGALSRSLVAYGIAYLLVCSAMTWKFGLVGAFAGLLVSAAIGWLLLFNALAAECKRQGIRIRVSRFPEARAILLYFALPAAASGATYLPAIWIGSSILVRQPNGYVQMALFSAAYTLMTAVLFIPNNAYVVGWSILNHQKAHGQAEGYASASRTNLLVVGGTAVAGALALAVLGPGFLRLFGRDFGAGYHVLLLMLAAAVPQALTLVILQRIQSLDRMWTTFLAVILPRDLLFVLFACVWTPWSGARGLADAYLAAWIVALLLSLGITFKFGMQLAHPQAL